MSHSSDKVYISELQDPAAACRSSYSLPFFPALCWWMFVALIKSIMHFPDRATLLLVLRTTCPSFVLSTLFMGPENGMIGFRSLLVWCFKAKKNQKRRLRAFVAIVREAPTEAKCRQNYLSSHFVTSAIKSTKLKCWREYRFLSWHFYSLSAFFFAFGWFVFVSSSLGLQIKSISWNYLVVLLPIQLSRILTFAFDFIRARFFSSTRFCLDWLLDSTHASNTNTMTSYRLDFFCLFFLPVFS